METHRIDTLEIVYILLCFRSKQTSAEKNGLILAVLYIQEALNIFSFQLTTNFWLQIGHCSNVATRLTTGREGRKQAWFWVVSGVGRALGAVKRPGKTLAAVQNALVCLSDTADSAGVAGVQFHRPSLV